MVLWAREKVKDKVSHFRQFGQEQTEGLPVLAEVYVKRQTDRVLIAQYEIEDTPDNRVAVAAHVNLWVPHDCAEFVKMEISWAGKGAPIVQPIALRGKGYDPLKDAAAQLGIDPNAAVTRSRKR